MRVQRRESCPPPTPSHAQTLCEEGAALAREGVDHSIHLISKGAMDGRQWRPSIADRGGSRDQAPPFGTPDGGGSRGKIFLFGDGGLLEGNSSSRRKVTAAAGRGRILVRGPYCLRCASEAWQWRLSFLGNRKKSRKSLKDFLLRGGAGGWRGFWRHQKSKFIIGITVPASHSA